MPRPIRTFERYGLKWPESMSLIDVIKHMIRAGGKILNPSTGVESVTSLFELYREMQTILWPSRHHHEWSDLLLKTILEQRLTTVQGPHDSSKTHTMAKYAITDYFCFPRETLILMSSTDLRGLELRVWGEAKDLFNEAKEIWPEAPGNAIDSMHGIFTDSVEEGGKARDIRRGIICIPVLDSDKQWVGLGKFAGIKQKRRRVISDECQFYKQPYLDSLSNLNKGDFKGVFSGNPIGTGEPLDKLAEPEEGWDNQPEVTHTTTWKTRMGGVCVQYVGSDSPGVTDPVKFSYMINQSDIDWSIKAYGKDSPQYWNQAMGIRRPGLSQHRVVTRDMARMFGAHNDVVWRGTTITSIYGLDAAYGGDRCVGIICQFGLDINGSQVISIGSPTVVPIRLYAQHVPEDERLIAEDQIASFVKKQCELAGIPPANVYFDSTGRGSLGTSFARVWSSDVNPLEFGGNPTPRPVSSDEFIYDDRIGKRRLKRADEHYSKKVTELWFAIRHTIEGRQMRNMGEDILDELCAREWRIVKGNKIEIETKGELKERLGRSPDLADALCVGIEGARRRGFNIARLEAPQESAGDDSWRDKMRERTKQFHNSFALNYGA